MTPLCRRSILTAEGGRYTGGCLAVGLKEYLMPDQDVVKVYAFRVFGSHVESPRLANFKATRETIRRLEGDLVPGTEEVVARSELDDDGRYRRIATGWGGLN
jgi:hypothetical protein